MADTFYIVFSGSCSIQFQEEAKERAPALPSPHAQTSSPAESMADSRQQRLMSKFKATGMLAGRLGAYSRTRVTPENGRGSEFLSDSGKTLGGPLLGRKLHASSSTLSMVMKGGKGVGGGSDGGVSGSQKSKGSETVVALEPAVSGEDSPSSTKLQGTRTASISKKRFKKISQGRSLASEMLKKERAGASELLKVALDHRSSDGAVGKYGKIVRVTYPGDAFGEAGLVGNESKYRSATVVANEPTELLYIKRNDYLRTIHDAQAMELDLLLKFLQEISIFKNSSTSDMKGILYCLQAKEMSRNTVIMKQGEKSGALYFIRSGQVRLTRNVTLGANSVTHGALSSIFGQGGPSATTKTLPISYLGPYQYFGEGCISGQVNDATITVNSLTINLLVLSKDDFGHLGHVIQEAIMASVAMRSTWRKEREEHMLERMCSKPVSGTAEWAIWLTGIPKEARPYFSKRYDKNKEREGSGGSSSNDAEPKARAVGTWQAQPQRKKKGGKGGSLALHTMPSMGDLGRTTLDEIIHPKCEIESAITKKAMKAVLRRSLEETLGCLSTSSWQLHLSSPTPIIMQPWSSPKEGSCPCDHGKDSSSALLVNGQEVEEEDTSEADSLFANKSEGWIHPKWSDPRPYVLV